MLQSQLVDSVQSRFKLRGISHSAAISRALKQVRSESARRCCLRCRLRSARAARLTLAVLARTRSQTVEEAKTAAEAEEKDRAAGWKVVGGKAGKEAKTKPKPSRGAGSVAEKEPEYDWDEGDGTKAESKEAAASVASRRSCKVQKKKRGNRTRDPDSDNSEDLSGDGSDDDGDEAKSAGAAAERKAAGAKGRAARKA